jgi:hypothetical protein
MDNQNQSVPAVQGTANTTELNITAETVKDSKILLEQLEELKPVMEVTSKYLEFQKDESYKMIFVGLIPMKNMDGSGTVDAVKLLGTDESFYVSASEVLVGSCRQLKPVTPIEITVLGKNKGKNGMYWDLKVEVLG